MKVSTSIALPASLFLLLGCGAMFAQDSHVSLAWKIAPECGTNFPSAFLQQGMEDHLRALSIGVSRVYTAGLVSDIACQVSGTKSLNVQQCLSLSQAVAQPSAANGLHLATTWRSCESYVCRRQNCEHTAGAAQDTLIGQFVPAFRALEAERKAANPTPAVEPQRTEQPAMPAVYAAASEPVLQPGAIIYMLYILTCLAVLIRWQLARFQAR